MYIQAKCGDLIFVRSNHIGSKLIRWWTSSIFDHVEISLGNGKTIGARPRGGVQINDVKLIEAVNWCVAKPAIGLMDEQLAEIINFAKSQVNKKYDWLGVIGFVIDRNINDPNRWFCSEFVERCFKHGKYPLIPRKSPSMTSPELIYQSWRVVPVSSNFIKI